MAAAAVPVTMDAYLDVILGMATSEMADRQFWGVVNHPRSGSDARLQSELMPTIGRNPK
jgi:hypothetical protein